MGTWRGPDWLADWRDLHWMVSTRVLMPDLLLDLPLITEIFRCFSAGTWKCIGGWEDFLRREKTME